MRHMINIFTGSFLRSLGRITCYVFIAIILCLILSKLGIDWSWLINEKAL